MMSKLIRKFEDGCVVEYGRGKFDDWCVYILRPSGERKPPIDIDYFADIVRLAAQYTPIKIYNDFVKLYSFVRERKEVCDDGHQIIDFIALSYEPGAQEIKVLFTVLYAAMVAEEKKSNTRLGAKIKRLGIHQILLDCPPLGVAAAANYSRGMKWREIELECSKRGF